MGDQAARIAELQARVATLEGEHNDRAELEARVAALEDERSDLLDRLAIIRSTATPAPS